MFTIKTRFKNIQLPSIVEKRHLNYIDFFSISSESTCVYLKPFINGSGEYNECFNNDGFTNTVLKYVIKSL